MPLCFRKKWPTSCYNVRKQEFWLQHEYKYTNCDYHIYQRLRKIWSTSFLTIIKTFLVPLSIPFLSFLFKKSVNILYFSTYCLQMTSKVVFVLLCFIHLPLFYFHVSLLVCKIGSSLLLKKKNYPNLKASTTDVFLGYLRIFGYLLMCYLAWLSLGDLQLKVPSKPHNLHQT